ncbi:adenylate kinase [Streptococcus cameli]
MKKIMVIGCPGSGKSTFSRILAQKMSLPLVHLDQLNWQADRTMVPAAVFLERLHSVVNQVQWIIDGNYGNTLELRLKACDTVIFLDIPVEECLAGIRNRIGKHRPDMPWVEVEEDPELMDFIRNFPNTSLPRIVDFLAQYSDKQHIVFSTRKETSEWLDSI